jgi:hypothetical protein
MKTSSTPSQTSVATLDKFVNPNYPVIVSEHARSLTLEKAQASSQISLIKKERGEDFVAILVGKILKESLKFIPSTIEANDIPLISQMFINEYWHFKIDDYILCMKNGINGVYGKTYGMFNYSTLMEWAGKYQVQKEEFYHGKHIQTKGSQSTTEETKHSEYKNRTGHNTNVNAVIPDENYFKSLINQNKPQ